MSFSASDVEAFPPDADMRDVLRDLEAKLRQTATMLRGALPDPADPTKPALPMESLVAPLESLQAHVDASDAALGDRLQRLRLRLDAAWPSPGALPPPVAPRPASGACHAEVAAYLSSFVRWDPPDACRWAPLAEEAEGMADWRAVAAGPWRRGLGAVVDDLVLRQLQYDGVPLRTAMEMELGCYERMAGGARGDVSVAHELRRGLAAPVCAPGEWCLLRGVAVAFPRTVQWLAPFVRRDGGRGLGADESVAALMASLGGHALLPRPTGARAAAKDGPSALSEATAAELFGIEETSAAHGRYFRSAEGNVQTPRGAEAGRPRRGGRNDDEEDEDEYEEEDDDLEEEEEEEEEEGEMEDEDEDLDEEYVNENEDMEVENEGGNFRGGSSAMEDSDDDDDDDEGEDAAGEEREGINAFGVLGSSVYDGSVADVRLPETEFQSAGYETGPTGSESNSQRFRQGSSTNTNNNNNNNNNNNSSHSRHYNVPPPSSSSHPTQGKSGDGNGLEGKENWTAFAAQRARILFSDLAIICALQHLAVTFLKTPNNDDTGGDASLQKAIALTLALRRHPLLAWRLELERSSGAGSDPLLLSFRHILLSLGYLPAAMQDDEKTSRLILCTAPFLRLWGQKDAKGVFACEGDGKALPPHVVPMVWRESVLADLLEQAHRLRQLEGVLSIPSSSAHCSNATPSTTTAVSSTRNNNSSSNRIVTPSNSTTTAPATTTLNNNHSSNSNNNNTNNNSNDNNTTSPTSPAFPSTTTCPDGLIWRYVCPLSAVMLQKLDAYHGVGLLSESIVDPQSASSHQAPSVVSVRRPPSRQAPFHQQLQHNIWRDNARGGFGTMMSSLASLGFRDRAGGVEESPNPAPQRQGQPQLPHRQSAHTRHTNGLMLDLPHANTILAQCDARVGRATPSLLYPREEVMYDARVPLLAPGANGPVVVWQPLFQKTMCYCPVTRRRCTDVAVCAYRGEGRPPEAVTAGTGFNPPQLLLCGHVISYRAMVALAERLPRPSRGNAQSVRCPYCTVETPPDKEITLRYIY